LQVILKDRHPAVVMAHPLIKVSTPHVSAGWQAMRGGSPGALGVEKLWINGMK
jgi:hypothetical protein